MKRKLLATLGLFAAAAAMNAPQAFASSDPPTATLDLRPAAAIESTMPNITPKVDATSMGAKNTIVEMTKATSGLPGWSAGIAKRDVIWSGGKALSGDEVYGISAGLSPRPGDSTAKFIGASNNATNTVKVLLAAAAPPNGFAREDLLAGLSPASPLSIGAA